ncbi:MAG: hypothetical protein R3C15_03965 [Thermoleophilia bacterium]
MQVGQVIDETFRLVGRFGLRWLVLALLPVAAAELVNYAIEDSTVLSVIVGEGDDRTRVSALPLLVLIVYFAATTLVQIAVTQDVARGAAASPGATLAAAWSRLWRALPAGLLVGVIVTIGIVLLVVPGLVALTRLAVTVPAAVTEDVGIRGALKRSNELVRGFGWSVFGTIVVLAVLSIATNLVLVGLPSRAIDSRAVELTLAVIVQAGLLALTSAAAAVMHRTLVAAPRPLYPGG